MMAIRWLEAHVRENNRQEAPTREQLRKLDCLKDLDLFETMCKVLNIPMEVKKIWARKRLMPWFRANMTAWLYEYAKKHMSKHGRVYSEYQLDIGAGAFKRAFVTHRNAHGGTDVNLVTALGFYSMFGSLESLLNLEQKHEMVTAISVEVFPGVLQTEQKYHEEHHVDA